LEWEAGQVKNYAKLVPVEVPMSEPFRILRYEDAGTRADGSPMYNKYWVTVEVDGNEHKVGLRSVTYKPQVQKELLGHPLRSEIEAAAFVFVAADLQAKLAAARKGTQ
jgi:hypothetical protein